MLDAASPTTHAAETSPNHWGGGRMRDPSDPPPTRWACVHTHPQAERWAEANLRRIGYTTYCPLLAIRRRDPVTPSITRRVLAPLFAGYLFLAHDPADPWTPIRYAPGVRDVIRSGNLIQYARAGAVEALQATEAIRRCLIPPKPLYAVGEAVTVTGGVFTSHPAVVIAIGHDMATVAILMLGHLREVALQLDCLRPRDE
jgi:transcription antitermination factor NusG